jgi:hypothetical protein
MALKTSLVITGDSSGAVKAADDLSTAFVRTGPPSRALAKALGIVDEGQAAIAASARNAASAQAILTKAGNDNFRSLGQQKAGMFQLGQNLQDVGVQMSMGTDLMRIMAMQGGQLTTAVDMIGVKGAGGRLAAFLAGPYGAIVLTATAILGPWITNLLAGADAEDKVSKGGLALVDALSKQKYATVEARKAIADYNEQQEAARKKQQLATKETIASADARIKDALGIREQTKAELEKARAQQNFFITPNGGSAAAASSMQAARAAQIADSLKAQEAAIAGLQQVRRNLLIEVGKRDGEAAADPRKGIELRYDLERSRAEDAAKANNRLCAQTR